MAKKGKGIFLVYADIGAEHEKEFNDWYNTEHLPELLAVPGILSAARYQAVKGGPKYLAVTHAVGTAGLSERDWIGPHADRRRADLPGRLGSAGARHGAGITDWPHVRPRRSRGGMERLV